VHKVSIIRALDVLALGGLIAYAGDREIACRRRAAFLGELASIPNLRLAARDAVAEKLRLVGRFFRADACILVCRRADSRGYALHRVVGSQPFAQPPCLLTESAARALLELPEGLPVAWGARRSHYGPAAERCCRKLQNLLEAPHFATVPYGRAQQAAGRLYLVSSRHSLARTDLWLLAQSAERIAAVAASYAALDALKREAASAERRRVSRDIHDTTIQPYIGLKYGLEALYRKLEPQSELARHVKELLEMSSASVDEMRGYVAQLRRGEAALPEPALPAKLRAQRDRYRALWGIDVKLRVARELQLGDRLSLEAYQLACEALSNVCRHTRATRAFVSLRRAGQSLVLEVGNERCPESPTQPFTPRSIAERACALGGDVQVNLDADGHDVVRVCVPMRGEL
jgi:signal transduction histidine kinase